MSTTQVRYTLTLDASSYDAQLAAAAAATNRFGQTAGTAVQPINAQLSALTATASQARTQIGAYSATWSQSFAQMGRGAEEATPKVKGLGVSAGQTAAAMRMLPAQITDITTSLASGMPVWLVAIQQGGQIKDSFGGVGPAFKAITGAISPLVAGLGTLAVVGGSVAAAYYQGSKEGDEFRRSLILTGNASGTTASQMDDMARRAAGAAESTRGATAAAVAQLAGTGQVAGDQLERFGAASVRWEKATGIAVSSTVEQFKALGKDPVAATVKLNEETNFLTKEVWAQITALDRQGKTTEAASMAQRAWADTIESRAKDLQANLGTIERAWNGVTGAAKKAWDAMLNIGREESASQKIESLQARIAETQRKLESGFGATGGGAATGRAMGVERRAQLQAELESLQEQLRLSTRSATIDNERATAQAKAAGEVAARVKWDQQSAKYLSDQVKMEQEIVDARSLGVAAGLKVEEIEKRVAAIRASYAKKTGQNEELNAYQNLVAAINQKTEAARQEALQGADLTESQRQQIALDEGLASGKLKLTDAHKKHVQQLIEELAVVERKNKGDQQRQKGLNALVDEELEARKALQEVDDRRMKLWQQESTAATRSLESARDSQELATLEFSLLGKSSKERQVAIDLRRIELALAREINRIEGLDVTDRAKGDLRQKANDLADLERSAAVSKATLEEAAGFIDSLDRTAHDTFVSVAKEGVGAFERIGDTLQSAVLDALYQMTVKKWIVSIAAQITGSGGAGAGLGSGSGLMGTLNNLSSLYNTGSTVAGWLGLGAAATGTGLAATAGTGMALASTAGTGVGLTAATGTGLSLAGAGTGLGLSATAGTGTALTAGASAGGAGIMSSIGAAMPYVAAFVAVASLLKGLDDSGTYHTGGAGSAGPAGLRQGVTAESLGMSSTVVSAVTDQAMEKTATSIASMFNSLGRGDFNVSTAFADDTSKDGAWGALRIERNGEKVVDWNDTRTSRWAPKEFADGEKGSAEYAAALAVSTREALLAMDLPGWADSVLQSLGDAPSLEQLGAAVQEISQTEAALENLGNALPWLASMSDETATSLLQLSGGIGNFAAVHQAYYDAMYSDAEKLADTRARMATALDEQGLAMPSSIAAWRELTKAQDRNTEAGREAYLTLIQLGPTFAAQMQSMLEQAGIGADSMASVIRDGLLGRLSAEDAGGQVAAMIVDGIYNAMANSASVMVTDILMQGIVQPMVMAASTGAAVTAAVSQATIDATVNQARVALQAIGAVLNDPAVAAMLSEIGSQTSALFAGYKAPTISSYKPQSQANQYQNQNADAAKTAEDAWTRAYSALERAVAAQRQAAEEQLQAATAIYDLAHTNARDLRGEVDASLQMTAAAGREFISEALANLEATGYLPDDEALGEAIAAARAGLDGKTYTSAFEFNRDRLILAGQLQAIADQTEPQMTAAEQQLEYLEGVLGTAQEQLDALKGIDNSVLSVAAALQAWQQAAGQSSGGSGTNASSSSVRYTSALDLRARAFDVGTDYVPTDMLALIHQGEQIVPKAYNPHANGQGGLTEALLQTLVEESRRQQQRLVAIEIATARTSSTLDDAARGRITLKTEMAS